MSHCFEGRMCHLPATSLLDKVLADFLKVEYSDAAAGPTSFKPQHLYQITDYVLLVHQLCRHTPTHEINCYIHPQLIYTRAGILQKNICTGLTCHEGIVLWSGW